MKTDRFYQEHLVINKVALAPGAEWAYHPRGWVFIYVSAGIGYWLHPRSNHELETGTALVLSDQSQGCFRASQLGEAVLQLFHVQPQRLTGLVSLADQEFMQNAAKEDRFALRVFKQTDSACVRFRQLHENGNDNSFPLRLQLLDIFIQTFAEELINQKMVLPDRDDARARLTKLLHGMAASDLLEMRFDELVTKTGCTPRHLTRIFHEIMGMSFRDKQTELRMIRAQDLLATSHSKVIEVALESGYQSVSLFNLMFKRRFGVSPAKWRERFASRKLPRSVGHRNRLLRF